MPRLVPRRIQKRVYLSMAILVLGSNILLVGCVNRSQYKGWVSVEKAPIRVIVVDSEKDVDPKLTLDIINAVSLVPFNKIDFNQKTEIGVNTDYLLKYKDEVIRNANMKVKK
jgi:hypothetical protein